MSGTGSNKSVPALQGGYMKKRNTKTGLMHFVNGLERRMSSVLCLAICMIFMITGCEGDRAMTLADLSPDGSSVEESAEEASAEPSGIEPAEGTETDQTLYVYVCGSVVSPGVYGLAPGSRVCDALEAAGGFTEDADVSRINLAAVVKDGDMIFFPKEGEDIPEVASVGMTAENDTSVRTVNINTADVELLCTLPGIGEAKAKAIIRYREEHGAFGDIKEIMNVSGIGENLYSNISELITVS